MRTYTVHLERDALAGEAHGLERAHLVPDGMTWAAFAFGPLWFFLHRLWLAGLGVLALLVGTAVAGHVLGLSPLAGVLVSLLVSLLVGLESSSLRRWTYARRGRPVRDVVMATSVEEAEFKAATRWLAGTTTVRSASTAQGSVAVPPSDLAIGMFPFSEARR